MKTIEIHGKEYVMVHERIKHFREKYPNYSLTTEILKIEDGFCLMKAKVIDENETILATGHASEKQESSYINKTSYIENCETSAWGRALANFGIGINAGIASADELRNKLLASNSIPFDRIEKTTPNIC